MIKNIFALVFVALIGVSSPLRAMPIQYTLSQLTGIGGSLLNGSITVDDQDMDGLVVRTEITAWDFTSTGGSVAFSFLSGSGSSVDCASYSSGACFSIGANSLISGGAATGLNNAIFFDPVSTANVLFQPMDPTSVDILWSETSNFDIFSVAHGGQGFSVATGSGTVPEPSSFALMVIALAMFFGVAARRPGTLQLSPV